MRRVWNTVKKYNNLHFMYWCAISHVIRVMSVWTLEGLPLIIHLNMTHKRTASIHLWFKLFYLKARHRKMSTAQSWSKYCTRAGKRGRNLVDLRWNSSSEYWCHKWNYAVNEWSSPFWPVLTRSILCPFNYWWLQLHITSEKMEVILPRHPVLAN